MPFREPNPPQGTGYLNNLIRNLIASVRAAKIIAGRGLRTKYTTNGTILELDAVAGSGISGMVYRGTYGSGTTYKIGDVVRVRSGTSQGVYVCVTAGTGHDPVYPEPADTGGTNYWEILALGIKQINVCSAGTDTTVYANTSATF